MNDINGRLLILRKTLGLSQELFASKVSMKRQTYANVEVGRIDVSIDLLKSLVTVFGANYLWLLDGTGEMLTDAKPYTAVDLHKVTNDGVIKYGTSDLDRLTNAINALRDSIDRLAKK